MNTIEKLLKDYFQTIKTHDYAYEYTEDMYVWRKWNNNENAIKDMIHSIVGVLRYSAEELLSESLSAVPEQFIDGSGKTHYTIRKWFTDYL